MIRNCKTDGCDGDTSGRRWNAVYCDTCGSRQGAYARRRAKKANDPEFKARRQEYHTNYFRRRWATDPEFRERRRAQNRARNKRLNAIKRAERIANDRRTCETCSISISHRGGRARFCEACAKARQRESANRYRRERWANDPEFRARIMESTKRYQRKRMAADPEYKEKMRKYHRDYIRKRRATDPEYREKMNKYARDLRRKQREAR